MEAQLTAGPNGATVVLAADDDALLEDLLDELHGEKSTNLLLPFLRPSPGGPVSAPSPPPRPAFQPLHANNNQHLPTYQAQEPVLQSALCTLLSLLGYPPLLLFAAIHLLT